MTIYSQADWATRALHKASIVDAQETPSADLSDWAVEVGTSNAQQLASQNIQIGNTSALDDAYYQIFAGYVACDLKAETGQISDAEAEAAKEAIKRTLRQMNPLPATGSTVQAEYF